MNEFWMLLGAKEHNPKYTVCFTTCYLFMNIPIHLNVLGTYSILVQNYEIQEVFVNFRQ